MAREVRTFAEGAVRWVQASGTGGWATASAALTALVGFVQAGAAWNTAQTIVTVMERGSAHHHKVTEQPASTVTFSYLQAVTGAISNPAVASGASTKQIHLELKGTDTELPSVTGQYFQFMNCVLESRGWSEDVGGNKFQETYRYLSMNGPTASGYLA